ncbi:MAG: 2-oxoglutarate dehydrogenase complex dihydrolipoyllysine-residue succinyltransferase [Candidatus Thiodiazotropha lotti]|uniref:Dihydrolipoyllysine-residue succinyltransferase component of 2-oxoglutarate dehydrogenase complex n=1 Tax=Candidatus Thiodiazotropha endoloripes TaxID=1818881 RepID=A0A1E2UQ45_9GAMM|nr:2-oxoglutarate dehydrogenase complex dihydrolipoyllysine-residue succinyltransferase [Candidatus Thiodiazotropha endoloripes]MCG7897966.1 2-oxoglutarate dehydrogenase complex dihydrolipoyllysine-residue succinyltransferase [Candidatus Thiodiazotropha weberae]MCG7992404.1 2-oxoglutarate dehydrogenase complex dihydrolipoyllysine-residue succinyltransferase [Candidatus Thiodiazotropha lotti]MCG7903778.1 2-oxoglutarate dehydrogenase complex dihydrolipoyllysine-residue succinyltransferase [Candida
MSIELRVPQLPESVSDATILSWHKQPGESVTQDETLVDLETDKVVLEVPAPQDGVLKEIRFKVGETVQAEDVLALMEAGKAAATTAAASSAPVESEAAAADEAPVLSPAVRRLVNESGIDPTTIKGSGKNGRIVKADVEAAIAAQPTQTAAQPAATAAAATAQAIPEGRVEERVPMTRLRKRVAERLVEAQHTAAILTTFNEVNLQAVSNLRVTYRESFEKKHDVRLGFMSFFVKAAVEALKQFPIINATMDGDDILYHGYFDIGIAVSSPRGLVVPILRDADQLSFAAIEQRIREYGEKAKQGTLSYDDLTGGTFSITNGGVFGSMLSTPILNPPQSAILGMHSIQQRPMVEKGEIVIRPMMYLALSYDHRIIDGRDAVQFLVTIKQLLEDPSRLLLEI